VLFAGFIVYLIIRYYKQLNEVKNKRKFELFEMAKAKEVFEAKMSFFTNVAHEVKTPLTLIKAPLEKVIKRGESTPEVLAYLKIMERNTNRLIDLSNQLLDFRQTEINGFSLSFTKVDITVLVEETYSSFKPLAEENKLNIQLHVPKNSIMAYIDMDAFNKILYNLFSNAIKYATTLVIIELQALNELDNYFTISIKNDGYIIPDDMKDKVFQPFFRLKETEKQKGTGIGLALSLSLVQLHNGKLELTEPEANLNVFLLKLPLQQTNEIGIY
jgi:signal transduction histidine kinase